MDIILEFYIRNHSGIDLHDTDIDFFRGFQYNSENDIRSAVVLAVIDGGSSRDILESGI